MTRKNWLRESTLSHSTDRTVRGLTKLKLKRIYAALTQAILHVSKFEISNARPPASSGWSLVSRRIDGLRDCRRGSAV